MILSYLTLLNLKASSLNDNISTANTYWLERNAPGSIFFGVISLLVVYYIPVISLLVVYPFL